MLIGIVGAPNKGKSTLFSAITSINVKIEDRPFTTIDPNKGIAFVTKQCVERELGVKCNPINSKCIDGIRYIPINVVDVAGLVEGAHEGRGMGNKFLNDIAGADALIIVIDASGKTDKEGYYCENCDPADDVEMVISEITEWIADIIKKHISILSRTENKEQLKEILSSLKVSQTDIEDVANKLGLTITKINWDEDTIKKFSKALLLKAKPIIIAANKLDKVEPNRINELKERLKDFNVIGCSAGLELAIQRAINQGFIRISNEKIEVLKELTQEQRSAIDYINKFLEKYKTTGVKELLNTIVFDILNYIVVYPVEDENKYTDHFGHILPDSVLVKKGTTAQELAYMIHTDLGKNMLYAIDAKKKLRVQKNYVLKDNDVIKIVSSAK